MQDAPAERMRKLLTVNVMSKRNSKRKANRQRRRESKRLSLPLNQKPPAEQVGDQHTKMDGHSAAALQQSPPAASSAEIPKPVSAQPSGPQSDSDGDNQHAEKPNRLIAVWWCVWSFLKKPTLTDWLIVGLYGGLLWIAFRQANLTTEANKVAGRAADAAAQSADAARQAANATKKSVELASDTAHKQLRAYLFLNREVKQDRDPKNNLNTFLFTVRNTGQTFAKDNKPTISYKVQNATDPVPIPTASTPVRVGTGAVIGPSQEVDLPVPVALTLDDVKAISDGKEIIWIFITLDYFDIFESEHAVFYCYSYVGKNGVFPLSPVINLSFPYDGKP